MKPFIPEEKKRYTLVEDWKFLLYPFNYYAFRDKENIEFTSIDGIIKDEKFTYSDPFRVCRYTDKDWMAKNSWGSESKKCVVDWFMLTDKEQPEVVSKLIRHKDDLESFGPMSDVVIIYTDWNGNGENKRYHTFTFEKYHMNNLPWPGNDEKPAIRFSSDIESRLKIFQEYWAEEELEQKSKFYSAMKLGTIWDKKIHISGSDYFPIFYTLPKGSIFTIKKLVYKDNRDLKTSKYSFVELILDGKVIIVLKEDFNTADIELTERKINK